LRMLRSDNPIVIAAALKGEYNSLNYKPWKCENSFNMKNIESFIKTHYGDNIRIRFHDERCNDDIPEYDTLYRDIYGVFYLMDIVPNHIWRAIDEYDEPRGLSSILWDSPLYIFKYFLGEDERGI